MKKKHRELVLKFLKLIQKLNKLPEAECDVIRELAIKSLQKEHKVSRKTVASALQRMICPTKF